MLQELRDSTKAKHRKIRESGFNLVVKRECEFKREMEENPDLDEIFSSMIEKDVPLDPRDAFYSGRTDANILYFKSDGESKMHYYDVFSLYPYVNKVGKYPKSNPKVHVGDDCLELP